MATKKSWVTFVSVGVVAIALLGLFQLNNAKEIEKRRRVQKESELSTRMLELAEKESALADLNKQKVQLEESLGSKIAQLEASLKGYEDDLKAQGQKVENLTLENESLKQDLASKDKALAGLNRQIQGLEKDKSDLLASLQKAQNTAASSATETPEPSPAATSPYNSIEARPVPDVDPVKLGKIVIQKFSGRAAEIQQVDPMYGFVVINAGRQDGMREKTVLNILRDKQVIGKAVVQQVRNNVSTAIVLSEWTKTEIKSGDFVSKY